MKEAENNMKRGVKTGGRGRQERGGKEREEGG
jgi:hypothetical protein